MTDSSSPDHFHSLLQSLANEVVKTEYSTFTYFITSLEGGKTVTSTDIVVSSNVVTSPPSIEATPLLQDVASSQVSEHFRSRFGNLWDLEFRVGRASSRLVGFILRLTSVSA